MNTSDPSSSPATTSSRVRRLAVADGDAVYARFIAELLAKLGHHTTVTQDGEELCDLVADASCDILIVGTHTTRACGFELVRRIGRLGFRGPLILHATCISDAEVSAYREVGVTMFVDRRATATILLEAIEVAISSTG